MAQSFSLFPEITGQQSKYIGLDLTRNEWRIPIAIESARIVLSSYRLNIRLKAAASGQMPENWDSLSDGEKAMFCHMHCSDAKQGYNRLAEWHSKMLYGADATDTTLQPSIQYKRATAYLKLFESHFGASARKDIMQRASLYKEAKDEGASGPDMMLMPFPMLIEDEKETMLTFFNNSPEWDYRLQWPEGGQILIEPVRL